jgi:hypothetical protein
MERNAERENDCANIALQSCVMRTGANKNKTNKVFRSFNIEGAHGSQLQTFELVRIIASSLGPANNQFATQASKSKPDLVKQSTKRFLKTARHQQVYKSTQQRSMGP